LDDIVILQQIEREFNSNIVRDNVYFVATPHPIDVCIFSQYNLKIKDLEKVCASYLKKNSLTKEQ